ncbi:unnamed protein product [Phaedon cochleariae]|uniref:Tetratricopeptide repeat protein 39C n=1 Tax=Phaedon cochleariae TaxID=80249 RepID=A0A9P0DCM7_PHACE|nr:unnamed protein product [Phaedon cochleariae]
MATNSDNCDETVPEDGSKLCDADVPEWILAREGIKLIINNKIDQAEKLFSKYPESIVMLAGHSFAIMIDALMSYEEEKLSVALLSLREIERRCVTESGWLKQVSQKLFGNTSEMKPVQSLADQLEMQIILADSQVCIAILIFLRQDISGYFKSGWVLRKAWKVYQKVYKEISNLYEKNVGNLNLPDTDQAFMSSNSLREMQCSSVPDWEVPESFSNGYTKLLPNSKSDQFRCPSNNNRTVDTSKNSDLGFPTKKYSLTSFSFLKKSMSVNSALSNHTREGSWRDSGPFSSFIPFSLLSKDNMENQKIEKEVIIRLMGAVSFGYGLFQLGISLLPPTLMRLINILGFAADRQNGLACLMYARLGSDMRAPLATLSLLWFHTIVRPFYAIDGTNVQAGADVSTSLLNESEEEFGQSSLFLFFRGRVCRLNSDTEGALKNFQSSVENSSQRELKVLCMHEIGWCHLIELDYCSAQNTFLYLKSSSRWSKAFYCYLAGICAGSCDNFLQFCLIEDMATLLKSLPKGTQLEEFLMKRNNCLIDLETAKTKATVFWKLLVFEMLYLWNALPSCRMSVIDGIIRDCSEVSDPSQEPMRGLSSLILGCSYCVQNQNDKAVESFRICLDVRKNLAPNCSDAHISAFCQYELASLLVKNEETREEGKLLLQKMNQYTKYDFDQKLNVRVHSLLRQY